MPSESKNTPIQGLGTHHIAVYSRDLDRSLHLYRDVMGMEIATEFMGGDRRILLLDVGDGTHIELLGPNESTSPQAPTDGNDPIAHLALTTDDTKAALEVVRSAGYKVTTEPVTADIGKGQQVIIAFFEGPDRELIELFQIL